MGDTLYLTILKDKNVICPKAYEGCQMAKNHETFFGDSDLQFGPCIEGGRECPLNPNQEPSELQKELEDVVQYGSFMISHNKI